MKPKSFVPDGRGDHFSDEFHVREDPLVSHRCYAEISLQNIEHVDSELRIWRRKAHKPWSGVVNPERREIDIDPIP
jgi:hypothetical protein